MSKIIFTELGTTPPPPSVGQVELYVKTDGTAYIQGSNGVEIPLGSSTAIAQLTGDVSAIGPGSAVATVNFVGGQSAANVAAGTAAYLAATSVDTPSTLVMRDGSGNFSAGTITASLIGNVTGNVSGSSSTFTGSLSGDVTGTQSATTIASIIVTGKLLTGYSVGTNTPIMSTDSILTAFENVQAQLNATSSSAITQLTGDVTAVGPGSVPATVNFVAGQTAANVAAATVTVDAATSSNVSSTLVERNASGNFSANIITAALNGNATTATSAISFTGSLAGDVTGTQSATVVSLVGGQTAATVAAATVTVDAATSSNVSSTLVERNASGNFSANIITAALNGNATTATTATNFTGSLSGDVTGTQGATIVSLVGGQTAATVAAATVTVDAATSTNTASTLVERDASGNFSANIVTANLNGNATTATNATTAVNFTGSLSGDVTGTQSATTIASTIVTGKLLTGYVVGTNTPIIATNSILTAFENVQAQLNATSSSAITQLTGDVTAIGPGSVPATVAAIQGNVVSGTTGTVNVVFSNAPILTGLLSGGSAAFTSTISASNLSGTNSGDVTVSNTNSIDLSFTSGQTGLAAALNLSAAAADASNLKATYSIKSDGLFIEYAYGTPVQIGSANSAGAASGFALYDHVHNHGNQTIPTFHAVATDIANGFMSSTDKTKLDAFSDTVGSDAQILISNGTNYNPQTVSGDATLTDTGAVTVTAIQTHSVSTAAPTDAQLLVYNSGTSKWTPQSINGDASITDLGAITLSTTAVTGKLLTGYTTGTNTPIIATNSILTAFENVQAQVSATVGSAITQLTGQVTAIGPGSAIATIATNTVTNSNLAQMPADTLKGNNTGSTANASDLTVSQVNTMLGTVTTIGTYDSQASQANGLDIVGNILYAQSATITNPGMVNATTQSFAGNKTFTGTVTITPASTSALVLDTNAFIFDSVNDALGIGLQPATNVFVDAINSTAASKTLQLTGYGVGSTVGTRGRFARGTSGSPAAVQSADIINFWSARGYGASQFAAASTAAINAVAGETFTNTSNLTYLQFSTTPTGSVTSAESMRIASTGITLGPQSASTAIHQVNGGINRTTRTVTASTLTVDTTTTDDIILTDSTSNTITITLPTATNGRVLIIQDKTGQSATNHITITPPGAVKINGVNASISIGTNYSGWALISDGTNWTAYVLSPVVPAQAVSSSSIDWSTGTMFTKTLSANTTFTFANAVSGQTIVIRLTNTASNYTVTWPTIKWPVQTTPVMTGGAFSDVYTVLYDGSNYFGSYVQNF